MIRPDHVPKDERKKLDSKSKRCIFLGYGATTKGYRQYDPLKKRACFSRNVVFNENKCCQLESEGAKGRMYLEYSDESDETVDNPEPHPTSICTRAKTTRLLQPLM